MGELTATRWLRVAVIVFGVPTHNKAILLI